MHVVHVEQFQSFVTKCLPQQIYSDTLQFCYKIHPRTEIACTQSSIDICIMIQTSDLEYKIHTLLQF